MSQKVTEGNSMIKELLAASNNRMINELTRRKRLFNSFPKVRSNGLIPLFVYDRMQTGYSENKNLGVHVSFGRAHTFASNLVLVRDVTRGNIYAEEAKEGAKSSGNRIRGELMGVSPETFLEVCSAMSAIRMFPSRMQIKPEESDFNIDGKPRSSYQPAYVFKTRDELTLRGLSVTLLPRRSFGNCSNDSVSNKTFFELVEDKPKNASEEALDEHVDYYSAWSHMADQASRIVPRDFNDDIPW